MNENGDSKEQQSRENGVEDSPASQKKFKH
jgi:hypothetical protein